jgi:hypothetical protein
MGIVGDLNQYQQFQTAQAIEAAAHNQGAAGEGLGLGLGMGLGQRAAGAFQQPMAPMQPMPQPGYQQPGYQQPGYQPQPGYQQPGYPQQQPGGPQFQAPPPLPQAEQWFVGVNGQQQGPFDRAQLAQQAAAGQLRPDLLVWKAGMAQWTPAGQVPEIAPLFGSVPPPLPPQA